MGYSHAMGRQPRRSRAGLSSRTNRLTRSSRRGGSGWAGFVAAARRAVLAGLLVASLIGLCLVCLAGYRWATSLPYFAIKDIRIEGARRLSYGEIQAGSGLNLGQNALAVNLSEVKSNLAGNPWIDSLSVQRVLPGTIVLKVKEREPAFWVRVKDKLFYAGPQGEPIAEVRPERFASLPYLELGEGVPSPGATLARLLSTMQRKDLPFGLAQTNWVSLSGRRGLQMGLTQPAAIVRLGSEDLAGDLAKLERVWKDLAQRGELDRIESLSVREGKAWVAFRSER